MTALGIVLMSISLLGIGWAYFDSVDEREEE